MKLLAQIFVRLLLIRAVVWSAREAVAFLVVWCEWGFGGHGRDQVARGSARRWICEWGQLVEQVRFLFGVVGVVNHVESNRFLVRGCAFVALRESRNGAEAGERQISMKFSKILLGENQNVATISLKSWVLQLLPADQHLPPYSGISFLGGY